MTSFSYWAFYPYGAKKEKDVAELNDKDKDKDKDKVIQPGPRPDDLAALPPETISRSRKLTNMLKNPLFWPSVCLVIILSVITSGLFFNIHFSWSGIWDALTDDKTWAKFGVIVAGIVGVFALVNEKLKSIREKSEDTNERVGLVERTSELISRKTYDIQKFIDDIQEENKKYWGQLNETQEQLQEVRNHYNASQGKIIKLERQISLLLGQSQQDKDRIASLEAQIAILQAQSIADKQTIANLQTELISLRGEIARTNQEKDRLYDENKELRTIHGRRSTDKLAMPEEAEARYNDLIQQQQETKKE